MGGVGEGGRVFREVARILGSEEKDHGGGEAWDS